MPVGGVRMPNDGMCGLRSWHGICAFDTVITLNNISTLGCWQTNAAECSNVAQACDTMT